MTSRYYGWIVVAVAFAAAVVVSGIRSAPAVFIQPLEAEFSWNRAGIASAVSLNLLLFGLVAPIAGRMMDRFGPRLVMLGALAVLAGAMGGTLLMAELWQLHALWGGAIGVGAGSTSVLAATIATRWFVAHRGLVVAVLSVANSTGQLVFIPLLMAVVVGVGWRGGSVLLMVAALVMLLPLFVWMRNDPSEVGQDAYGGDEPGGAREAAFPLQKAVRSREFWLLAGSFFVCGATSNGLIGTHFIPHSIEHGIPAMLAATTVGIMGAMNVVGTLASGWLSDRYDPRRLLALYYGFRGVSLLLLPLATDIPGLFVFAVIYGLDWLATVPPTVTLVVQRYGRQSIGSIYGWVFLAHQVGAASMALLAGIIRVELGDYWAAFFAGALLCMVAAGMAQLIRQQDQPSPVPPGAGRPLPEREARGFAPSPSGRGLG